MLEATTSASSKRKTTIQVRTQVAPHALHAGRGPRLTKTVSCAIKKGIDLPELF
jgi:hypothetical protein